MECPRCAGLLVATALHDRCLNCGHYIFYAIAAKPITVERGRVYHDNTESRDRICKTCGQPFRVRFTSMLQQNCSKACGYISSSLSLKGQARINTRHLVSMA